MFYPENAHLIFWRTHPQTREEGDKSRNAARRRPRRPQRSETSSRLFPTRSIRPASRASTSLHRSRPSSFQGTSSSRAQKKKMASSHTRHFKALTMHARKTRTAPPHRTFPPLFLASRNALRSHALTRLRARTTNTHTTTHTCTLLCLFSREQATSLHVCRQCRTACL